MAVTTTIRTRPRSTDLDGLDKAIESHPIWTELRGPVTLIHMGARYYSPDQHRFLQTDPKSHQLDLTQQDAYAYAGGDPVNHTDPSGADTAGLVYAGFGVVAFGLSIASGGIGFAGFAGLSGTAGSLAGLGAIETGITSLVGGVLDSIF